ncbi:MAG: fumarylacetoacetate hydrolase family protein, partial [Myxococcales bacterium]|nr:fumarylacetoacetate hydrolase family protein [Myxococcales bacterium]
MHIVTFERREPARSNATRHGRPGPGSMEAAALGFETLDATRRGARRLGALLPSGAHAGTVVDLNRAFAVKLAAEDAGAPEAEADSLLPSDALHFVQHLPGSLDAARTALDFALHSLDRYDALDLTSAGVIMPRKGVRLCAPVPHPGKILGVARNYGAHASERGEQSAAPQPVLFLKAPTAVIGPEDDIVIPAACSQADYEGELAAVISHRTHCVRVRDALRSVAGYCVANDVTARDYQNARGQHFLGKSCDTFAPLGPALVTADEIPDPQDLSIRTSLSGDVVQTGNTKEMRFSVAEIIAFASQLMTLEPGDVVLTGTPA